MSGIVEDVSDANYKEFTDSSGAVVAYGLATCEPCKTYDPILEDAAAKFPEIKVGKAKMHVPGRCREIKKIHSLRDLSHHAFLRKRQAPAHPRGGSRQGRTRGADFRLPPQVKQKLRTSTPSTLCCISYCRKPILSAVKRSGTKWAGKDFVGLFSVAYRASALVMGIYRSIPCGFVFEQCSCRMSQPELSLRKMLVHLPCSCASSSPFFIAWNT